MGRALCFLFVFVCGCSTDSFTSGDSGGDSGGDGAVDAGPPDCGTGPTFCQEQPPPTPGTSGGCDDFDENAISNNGWTADMLGTPTAALDTGDFASCPASLLIDVPMQPAPTGSQFAHFYLTQSIQSTLLTAGKLVLDFEAKLPNIGTPDAGATVSDSGNVFTDGFQLVLVRKSNDLSYNVRIERSADGFWFLRMGTGSSGGTATEVSAPITPLEGAWNHITLTVQFSSGAVPGNAVMTYTNTANQSALAKTPIGTNDDGSSAALNVDIGAAATTVTSQEWFFGYDNVMLSAD